MSSGQFCLDANLLITAWNITYPADVFPALWKQLGQYRNEFILIQPIFEEIDPIAPADRKLSLDEKRAKYPLRMWMQENLFEVTPITDEVNAASLELKLNYEITPLSKGAGQNDVTLIAYAKITGKTVVTLESEQPNKPRNPPRTMPYFSCYNACYSIFELRAFLVPPSYSPHFIEIQASVDESGSFCYYEFRSSSNSTRQTAAGEYDDGTDNRTTATSGRGAAERIYGAVRHHGQQAGFGPACHRAAHHRNHDRQAGHHRRHSLTAGKMPQYVGRVLADPSDAV
jgi:hypothetical protein